MKDGNIRLNDRSGDSFINCEGWKYRKVRKSKSIAQHTCSWAGRTRG
jgi:hypothetical protein